MRARARAQRDLRPSHSLYMNYTLKNPKELTYLRKSWARSRSSTRWWTEESTPPHYQQSFFS
ncbi:hypothetical protein RHMOL_Rhmol13G0042400 [Rhododendron molle]|uniref:Uncharacterized protein n=1 Tax=Rhododendron molle TaxID=49168 RepID=A0ACC0L3R4_RHOML|nr:hypothetical protein RHMOL_Rhmol13G0042400 [Rhododendron molle]